MKSYGRCSIAEFLHDRIVYRNLQVYDRSLPTLVSVRRQIGMDDDRTPRKNELDYARVVVELLKACRRQDQPDGKITQLVFVGDTRLLDGTAFANLCQVSGWSGFAFIGSENDEPAVLKTIPGEANSQIMLANRWSALAEFDQACLKRGMLVSEGTAVVLDMDKTMVGARGRNGQVIDQARMEAVRETAAEFLGDAFDPISFQEVYEPLNQPEFHPFTGDNQDYLAYICLILGTGLFSYSDLVKAVRCGQMSSFNQFIGEVDTQKKKLPAELMHLHQEIFANVQSGDPTPFKAFRRNEYRLTVERFGKLEDSAPVPKMLAEEILVTEEVRRMALKWRAQGALIFGLSDKPDEASLPPAELADSGYPPLHRANTHSVGE